MTGLGGLRLLFVCVMVVAGGRLSLVNFFFRS
jgi:hypothetical protein